MTNINNTHSQSVFQHSMNSPTNNNYNTFSIQTVNLSKYNYFEKYNHTINQHLTNEIGEPIHKDISKFDRSTFTTVLEFIEVRLLYQFY
jgi:hypothetical protein